MSRVPETMESALGDTTSQKVREVRYPLFQYCYGRWA
jgi:hypothetical protein